MKLALLLPLVLLACPSTTPEPRPFPLGPLDAGIPPYDPDAEPVPDVPERAACARMCDHMKELGCPLGQPTPVRREPCVSWCTRIQSKHEIDLHPDCIASAPSCDRTKECR
jgi:hypothetical protein